MTCRSCGATIADKAIVCYRCGTPTADPATSAPPVRRPRPTPWLAWLVVAAVLALSTWALIGVQGGSTARGMAWAGVVVALSGAVWLARRR